MEASSTGQPQSRPSGYSRETQCAGLAVPEHPRAGYKLRSVFLTPGLWAQAVSRKSTSRSGPQTTLLNVNNSATYPRRLGSLRVAGTLSLPGGGSAKLGA